MVQDFARRYVAAGGKMHSGSDPGSLLPAYGLHAELELAIDAGLSPLVAIQSASLNVAKTWGKDKDFGSVEKGKVADLVIVRGDVMNDITATQNVEKVFMDGKAGRYFVQSELSQSDPAHDCGSLRDESDSALARCAGRRQLPGR